MARPVEDDNVFFFDTFLLLCEQALRFNFFVTDSMAAAFSCVHRTTEEFYSDLKGMEDSEERLPHFIQQCWQGLQRSPRSLRSESKDRLTVALAKCSPEERGYLAALDCLGLSPEETCTVFALDNVVALTDKVNTVRQRLAKDGNYAEVKPRIQSIFRTASLRAEQRGKLCELILPGFDAQAAQDKTTRDAESVLHKERRRNYLAVGMCLIMLGVAARYWQQRTEGEPKVIEWLGYETLAIEEDPQRLGFPSDDVSEIRAYFDNQRGLGFKPQLLHMPVRWQPRAAGIIDYDARLVTVVKYESSKGDDVVLHYAFRGKTNNLAAPENSTGDFTFRSYASDDLNMIAWSQGRAIGVLVGRLGTDDLVALGRSPSPE